MITSGLLSAPVRGQDAETTDVPTMLLQGKPTESWTSGAEAFRIAVYFPGCSQGERFSLLGQQTWREEKMQIGGLANTGIANLDHGKIADPTKLEPLHIAIVSLK